MSDCRHEMTGDVRKLLKQIDTLKAELKTAQAFSHWVVIERDKLKIANDYHKAQHGHYALEANQLREELELRDDKLYTAHRYAIYSEAYLAEIFNIVDTPVQNATGLSHLKEIRQVFRRRAALLEGDK